MKTVLSVGHCMADHSQLVRWVTSHVDAEVVAVKSQEAAQSLLPSDSVALMLVNRVFDATGESGLEFLKSVKDQPESPPVILLTNYPDVQQLALESGAVASFGKASLHEPTSIEILVAAITLADPG